MKAYIPYTGTTYKSRDEAKTAAYTILAENPGVATLAIYKISSDGAHTRWFNVSI